MCIEVIDRVAPQGPIKLWVEVHFSERRGKLTQLWHVHARANVADTLINSEKINRFKGLVVFRLIFLVNGMFFLISGSYRWYPCATK